MRAVKIIDKGLIGDIDDVIRCVCERESVRGRVCESAFVCVCVDIIDQGRICEINNVIQCL